MDKMIGFYKKAVLKNYINFKGRANLPEYWWFVLANIIISLIIGGVEGLIGVAGFGLLYSLILLLPSLSAAVRRLHDIGKSGWWILIGLIPLVGWIWITYLLAQKSKSGKK